MTKGNILLLGIIGTLLLVIAFGIGWLVYTGNQPEKDYTENNEPKYDLSRSVLFPVGSEAIISNLNTGDVRDRRVIRVRLNLRIADNKMVTELETDRAVIIDEIITILRAKTPAEVIQPEAKEMIKKEIIDALNTCFNTDKILDVYFEEFIVQ